MSTLETAARAAGLEDLDLLKVAKPALGDDAAIADLRRRYPAAFKSLPKYDAMTNEQRVAFHRQNSIPLPRELRGVR